MVEGMMVILRRFVPDRVERLRLVQYRLYSRNGCNMSVNHLW